ncbi:MAG TPA: transposase [Polyangia bacterium]|jgi:hypothetical protein|nr:transposase [Polyangia bacterium]
MSKQGTEYRAGESTSLADRRWRQEDAEKVLAAGIMHLDGTGLPVLDRSAVGGKHLGALWGYVGDTDVAAYLFASTGKKQGQREGELGPEDMPNLRTGYTVADASKLFDKSFKGEDLVERGCNMHSPGSDVIQGIESLLRRELAVAVPDNDVCVRDQMPVVPG